jgi:predicted small lipoprotein YifL
MTRSLLTILVLASLTGFAQEGPLAPKPKKKVIRLDAITVEGRIQKPQAFYILQRSTLNFDELNRAESFVPKVEKSVEKDAF